MSISSVTRIINPLFERLFIPGNVPSSKNNKIWTGKFLVVSAATKKWRKESKQHWQEHREEFLKKVSGLSRPYFIHLTFIRRTRQMFDYTNVGDTVLDEMVAHGWLNDDNADCAVPVYGKYEYDPLNPGVYIGVVERPTYEFI